MEKTTIYYALFKAHPSTRPPFTVELGYGKDKFYEITNCQHVPDAIEQIEAFLANDTLEISPKFVLLYPIYLDAMDTDHEGTMHQIAWLIKEQADAKKWEFNRTDGYTGYTANSFVP